MNNVMSNVVDIPIAAKTQTRPIARGPNVGQPQSTADIVLDGLSAAKCVIGKLRRNGFTVISASAACTERRYPTVQVQYHRLCAEMIAAGEAGYFLRNPTELHGEFFGESNDGRRVRIVWVEQAGAN